MTNPAADPADEAYNQRVAELAGMSAENLHEKLQHFFHINGTLNDVCPQCLRAETLLLLTANALLHSRDLFSTPEEFIASSVASFTQGLTDVLAQADETSQAHSPTHAGPRTSQ